jgi:hypothetical protein
MSTLNAGEIGKTVYFITLFDMSARTSITLRLENLADGSVVTVSNARVQISATPITTPDYGLIPANQYAYFNTEATDFPVEGDYRICLIYEDATPRKYFSNHMTVTVGEACA